MSSIMSILNSQLLLFFFKFLFVQSSLLKDLDLAEEHLPFYFSSYPEVLEKCRSDFNCPYQKFENKQKVCWGYENDRKNCNSGNSYSRPSCPGDHRGWVEFKKQQISTFYKQGDFGYVEEQLKELADICIPNGKKDKHHSSLECSKHLRFCRGHNIMVNFTSLARRTDNIRYNMDVLSKGDVGGYCRLNQKMLNEESDQISPLQSWGPELRFFTEMKAPISNKNCDVIVDTPTFIMKIDATVNLYHHFCDFFNLYASQHVNNSHPDAFSTDVQILIWESYDYRSNFGEAWKVFTRHPLWNLNTFRGKSVCFRNVVFPLLPRMIFGLYYNTPIIWGCEGSGLFRAFSQHFLHRMRINTVEREEGKLRVTLLSRESSYRNILNEQELLTELKRRQPQFIIQRVVYNSSVPFPRQLDITRNSDIFIGIHGAGLTHLLFLPDWAVVFELYNCEDEHCYQDLARLRGVKYITWEKKEFLFQQDKGHHPDGGAHAKFTNYRFDPHEFVRLVNVAASHVQNHKVYKEFINANKVHDEL